MIPEYKNEKVALLSALEQADSNLHANTSTYAVIETEDPLMPFDVRWVHRAGEESDEARRLNERLFDHGFLDFGYKEVRSEKNLDGVPYEPVDEMFANANCIGVAPFSFFDDDAAKVRMAHEAEDEKRDETDDVHRFARFLKLIEGHVISGEPPKMLTADEVSHVCGLLFKYATSSAGDASCVLAFQRTQRMWIQQKSSYLLFEGASGTPQAFSSRSIRVGTSYDFVLFGQSVYFRNLRALEILFKFNRLVAQRAKDYADTLDPIVADFEKLDERIDASRGVANRLLKMQREGSPVAELDRNELERRANRIAYYSHKLKFNEEGKIMLTTNREVNDFLRMLNDDYLVSPLTNAEYEARAKKPLKGDEDGPASSSQPYDDPFA